ncbi:hypothetical protein E2C01_099574 [Portunus trituberculatus]|uniref:Uncharacterized protein n=1 Tax=Portunus trituberculatus TaxID=210409 RepID=A0A5B7KAS4_PORTR|nr:hypothetical protein [Portunus trituberculatus]
MRHLAPLPCLSQSFSPSAVPPSPSLTSRQQMRRPRRGLDPLEWSEPLS